MSWEIVVNPIVVETLQYYDAEVAAGVISYLEHQLHKLPEPKTHADRENELSGIMTFSRTTLHGVVMIFAQVDYEGNRIKILHVQLRNNASDKGL